MSFSRGVAVSGFGGVLLDKSTGDRLTTGSVTGYIIKDGATVDALTNSVTHKGQGAWTVDLTATEMDADFIIIIFTHASGIARDWQIRTGGKVDGVTRDVFEEILLAFAAGKTALSENGDGTKTLTYYKQDDATARIAWTFNANGERESTDASP